MVSEMLVKVITEFLKDSHFRATFLFCTRHTKISDDSSFIIGQKGVTLKYNNHRCKTQLIETYDNSLDIIILPLKHYNINCQNH